jgi:hypothetical protein
MFPLLRGCTIARVLTVLLLTPALESGARACHGVAGVIDIPRVTKRLGYKPIQDDVSELENSIKRPEDILSAAPSR